MVDTVIVNGEIVVEKGRLLRIDEWQKSAYANKISHELLRFNHKICGMNNPYV